MANGSNTAEIGFEQQIWRAADILRGKFAEQEGKLAGEFYTPACVVRTLVEVLKPFNRRVYDIITTKTIQFNLPCFEGFLRGLRFKKRGLAFDRDCRLFLYLIEEIKCQPYNK